MSSEMIERVAKAIRNVAADIEVSSRGETDPDPMVFSERYARAAIEAMREPTEDMHINCGMLGPRTIREQWRYMIDEALKSSTPA